MLVKGDQAAVLADLDRAIELEPDNYRALTKRGAIK